VLTCPRSVANLKAPLQQQKENTALPTCSYVLWIQLSKYIPQLKPGGEAYTFLLLRPVIGTNNVLCFAVTIITNVKHLAKSAFSSFCRFSNSINAELAANSSDGKLGVLFIRVCSFAKRS